MGPAGARCAPAQQLQALTSAVAAPHSAALVGPVACCSTVFGHVKCIVLLRGSRSRGWAELLAKHLSCAPYGGDFGAWARAASLLSFQRAAGPAGSSVKLYACVAQRAFRLV